MENRLSSFTDDNGTQTFAYDPDGQRLKRTRGGQTVHYPSQHYEKNVTTGVVTTYYSLGGRLVALRKDAVNEYVQLDHLGSVVGSADGAGGQVASLTYAPWGKVVGWASSGTLGTDKKYTEQRDETVAALVDLYYYGARYYEPGIGRWLSADPVVPSPANPQALNRYSYVLNNPLRFTDPTGLYHNPELDAEYADVNAALGEVGGGAGFAPAYIADLAARAAQNAAEHEAAAASQGIPGEAVVLGATLDAPRNVSSSAASAAGAAAAGASQASANAAAAAGGTGGSGPQTGGPPSAGAPAQTPSTPQTSAQGPQTNAPANAGGAPPPGPGAGQGTGGNQDSQESEPQGILKYLPAQPWPDEYAGSPPPRDSPIVRATTAALFTYLSEGAELAALAAIMRLPPPLQAQALSALEVVYGPIHFFQVCLWVAVGGVGPCQ